MPLKLGITTTMPCVNRCSYCPQDALIRSYTDPKKKMTLNDFKKIMRNVPKNVLIEFAGFTEAFTNHESSLMMKYSIENKWVTDLYTTFVGFTDNDLKVLRGLSFNVVSFHQCDTKGFNVEKFKEKIEIFKQNVIIKYPRMGMTPDMPGKYSYAGLNWERPVFKLPFYCGSTPYFDHNQVLPNGDVSFCCFDSELKHIIGNLHTTHYNDLDRQSIINLSNQRDSEIICRKCEVMKEQYPFPKF